VTLFGLVFTPVFCLVIRWFTAGKEKAARVDAGPPQTPAAHPGDDAVGVVGVEQRITPAAGPGLPG